MREQIDVLDANCAKTGEIELYDAVHKKGFWHKTVHVWVMNSKDELLVQQRSPKKVTSPNKWDISIAGHVSAGQMPEEAILREANEETGMDFSSSQPKYLFSVKTQGIHRNGAYINNECQNVYLLKKDLDLNSLSFDPDEVSGFKYIAWQDLKKKIEAEDDSFASHPEEYKKLFEILEK